MKKDYYKILEVSKEADSNTIKKSFRRLAKKYHPDTNNGDEKAAQRFQEINEAYSVIGDEAKRKAYDTETEKNDFENYEHDKTSSKQTRTNASNPFAGFQPHNFKMDFGDMMFEELNKEKAKKTQKSQIDFGDVSSQFASFFGFRPK